VKYICKIELRKPTPDYLDAKAMNETIYSLLKKRKYKRS
jgi:hypothetical protein